MNIFGGILFSLPQGRLAFLYETQRKVRLLLAEGCDWSLWSYFHWDLYSTISSGLSKNVYRVFENSECTLDFMSPELEQMFQRWEEGLHLRQIPTHFNPLRNLLFSWKDWLIMQIMRQNVKKILYIEKQHVYFSAVLDKDCQDIRSTRVRINVLNILPLVSIHILI